VSGFALTLHGGTTIPFLSNLGICDFSAFMLCMNATHSRFNWGEFILGGNHFENTFMTNIQDPCLLSNCSPYHSPEMDGASVISS
jgi:hypothetical protein